MAHLRYRVFNEGEYWLWELVDGGVTIERGKSLTDVKARANAISRALSLTGRSPAPVNPSVA